MQISAHFTAVWMQMPHSMLCGVKVLQNHPALSELPTNTGFMSCTLSPMIYDAFSAQVCCFAPGTISVSVGTF